MRKRVATIAATAAAVAGLMAIPAGSQAQGLDLGDECEAAGFTVQDRQLRIGNLLTIEYSICKPAGTPGCDNEQQELDLSPIAHIGYKLCLPPFE